MDPSTTTRGETDSATAASASHHSAASSKERKKRHHGLGGGGGLGGAGSSGAAAIAARRLGGPALPPMGTKDASAAAARRKGDGEGEGEEPFISSSRDASEEDNDDASGYSDSASSLRMPQPLQSRSDAREGTRLSSLEEVLPTSARDRAVVDSKQAHTRRLSPTGGAPIALAGPSTTSAGPLADKTPSSSSPPRQVGSLAGAPFESSARRPSAAGMAKGDAVRDTLVKASAALSSSSSAELAPGDFHEPAAPSARPVLSRTESMSSADSDVPNGPTGTAARKQQHHHHHHHRHHHQSPPMPQAAVLSGGAAGVGAAAAGKEGSGKLDLGSLPAQTSIATAMPTPRAQESSAAQTGPPGKDSSLNKRRQLQHSLNSTSTFEETEGEDADATDGAPYDGDVEFAARGSQTQQQQQQQGILASVNHPSSSITSSSGYYASPATGAAATSTPADAPSKAFTGASTNTAEPLEDEQQVTMPPASMIRSFVHKAIYEPLDPTSGQAKRDYKINQPPDGGKNPARPVRIYADGVYDLFHYAHALQLRQAKLSFPSVHLIVGVVSSRLCAQHKNKPVMSSAERYAAVRNCRWVDEVVEDAPWVINQELLDLYRIDYVAHDEVPYGGTDGAEDIYKFVKDQGRFLPTNRTPGVSTSELLARIVEQYREHAYDGKLVKIGHAELAFK